MDTLMSLQMSDPIAQHLGSWSQEINVLSICLRIALAVFLTSVIGCERSSKRHSDADSGNQHTDFVCGHHDFSGFHQRKINSF